MSDFKTLQSLWLFKLKKDVIKTKYIAEVMRVERDIAKLEERDTLEFDRFFHRALLDHLKADSAYRREVRMLRDSELARFFNGDNNDNEGTRGSPPDLGRSRGPRSPLKGDVGGSEGSMV